MFDYFREYFDFKGLFVCLALVAMGLVSIYSATYDAGAGAIFEKQTVWVIAGVVAMLVAAFFPFKLLQRLAVPIYALTLGALFSVLLPIDAAANSSTSSGERALESTPGRALRKLETRASRTGARR